jgi:arylsulfatase A-like enzyme
MKGTWRVLFNLVIFGACFYAFMEWLFFVTKPSSLSILTPPEAALVLVETAGVVLLPLLGGLGLLFLLARLRRGSKWAERLPVVASVIPALALSVTALVMFDNFTYTVFKFGIVSTFGPWRALYLLGFGLMLWRTFRFVRGTVTKTPQKNASFLALRLAQGGALGLLAVSTGAILLTVFSRTTLLGDFDTGSHNPFRNRPDILLLASDGLSATYLSAYGYEQETTPFLSRIMATSLVAENAFPNASSTTASTTSVLTGKEPATVGVYRYPDVLSGKDSYEHLPGILKQYGYTAVQIGTPYYVDAAKLNLLDGFDVVNSQSLDLPALGLLRSVLGNTPSTYFIWTVQERAGERLLHIFFIEEMRDPLAEVNDPSARLTDEERVEQIIELLDQSDRPVFIMAHLMGTHGPHFAAGEQETSSESSVDEEAPWDQDLYEAAIRGFDSHLEKIYTHLAETGKLDNTIIVIYTDHGFRYNVNHRIPVIIHFPRNAFAGRLQNNVQIIDIPATLVDYLGIRRPSWMAGVSLLKGEPPADREIISVIAGSPRKIAPPFFQIKTMQVIVCQKWYQFNVQEKKWTSGDIYRHTARCADSLIPPEEDVREKIVDYLEVHGFDISSIQ